MNSSLFLLTSTLVTMACIAHCLFSCKAVKEDNWDFRFPGCSYVGVPPRGPCWAQPHPPGQKLHDIVAVPVCPCLLLSDLQVSFLAFEWLLEVWRGLHFMSAPMQMGVWGFLWLPRLTGGCERNGIPEKKCQKKGKEPSPALSSGDLSLVPSVPEPWPPPLGPQQH